MKQAKRKNLYGGLLFFMILASANACSTCNSNPSDPPVSSDTSGPIKVGHVAFGSYNQQTHSVAQERSCTGNGSCACIVGIFLQQQLSDPKLNLHQDSGKIDDILAKGIDFYADEFSDDANNNRATDIDDVLAKLNLRQDQSTMVDLHNIRFLQTKPLLCRDALHQELDKYSSSKKLALVRTGPEAWGLISHGDGTFDIFDSHGRPELHSGNSAAFIQRTNLDTATKHIWLYSPLAAEEIQCMDEGSKLNSAVYIYWLQ